MAHGIAEASAQQRKNPFSFHGSSSGIPNPIVAPIFAIATKQIASIRFDHAGLVDRIIHAFVEHVNIMSATIESNSIGF